MDIAAEISHITPIEPGTGIGVQGPVVTWADPKSIFEPHVRSEGDDALRGLSDSASR